MIKSLPIKDAIVIDQNDVCLLTLEEPYWRVGWAGISYISSIEDLRPEKLKIVNHPEKVAHATEEDLMIHVQLAKRFALPPRPLETNPLAVEHHGITGSLICKIVEKKPFIVGVQASDH